jgi:hypothetical protein
MKYLKTFNESILNDIRKENDKSLSDIRKKLGSSTGDKYKFCHECGTKLDKNDSFCGECGAEQESDKSVDKFTIKGELSLVYTGSNGAYAKTPFINFSSPNKTLSGTKIKLSKFDWMELSKKLGIKPYYQDEEKSSVNVSITGTTKNGESPTFQNPIIVDNVEDIKRIN